MNEAPEQNTLKALQIIHKALLFGQIIFASIVLFLKYTDDLPPDLKKLDQALQVIAILLSVGGFFIGSSIFKRKIQQVMDTFPDIKAKAKAYRSACILQWALLEGPSLFCIICFFLVGNYAFLALAAVLMLLFALLAPVKLKIMLQLKISEAEMENF